MLDRDANWGCVRGMINVTPRGPVHAQRSITALWWEPEEITRASWQEGDRRRSDSGGLKRSESHCFLCNYFIVQEKTYGNACPVSTVISCRECFILFGQRAVGPLQFLSVLCFCINILILQVKQILLTEKQDMISS